MGFEPEKHYRRSIRLRGYDYSRPGGYFVTVCVRDRECLFGNVSSGRMRLNCFGGIADLCWRAIPAHQGNVALDAFVVMPNHVHGIIVIGDVVGATHASPLQQSSGPANGPKPGSIGAVIGSFKSAASKRINELRQTPGTPVWQRNYFEHVIRNRKEWARIRQYIEANPARWAEDGENPLCRLRPPENM